MVSFTGSSATGSKIMTTCAQRLAQTMLELGGKSALVVYDDVQLEEAVEAVMRGFLTNGGQICTAHSRLVVHEAIKAPLLARLKEEMEKLPFCDDPISECDRGDNAWVNRKPTVLQPVICKSQHDKIGSMLQNAREDGVAVICGGFLVTDRPGYYVQPTIFLDPPCDNAIWQEEVGPRGISPNELVDCGRVGEERCQPYRCVCACVCVCVFFLIVVLRLQVFGPVLCVRSFTTDDEAVAEANSTRFGLASTVMCADPTRCRKVANRVRAGAVYATSNGKGLLFEFPQVQRGGYGQSGIGRELGLHGLYEYTELKSINFTGFTLADATAAQ